MTKEAKATGRNHHHHAHQDLTRSRRALLKGGGLGLLALGLGGGSPSFLSRAAWAAGSAGSMGASAKRKTLVTIFQRGAMDGLAAVSPLSSGALRKARPGLVLPSPGRDGGLIELRNSGFGLNPALSPLGDLFHQGQLSVVHAVGSPDPTRSHFDAQDYMEAGSPGDKGTRSGWLNRVAGALGHEGTPFRALSMTSALPKSLYGKVPSVAVARLEDLQLKSGGALPNAEFGASGFEALYQQTSQDLLREAGRDTFAVVEALASVERQVRSQARTGESYPKSPLGEALQQIALLIKAEVGLEVAFAESGGWDTHVRQGSGNGNFSARARDLAGSIGAFWKDIEPYQDRVALMTMTEFGRTVRQNGSGGTDHGHGSCLFLLGDKVDGGKVHGDLSLDSNDLYEGRDLAVTTDFRSVFAGVARDHLGVAKAAPGTELFPGWKGKALSLFES